MTDAPYPPPPPPYGAPPQQPRRKRLSTGAVVAIVVGSVFVGVVLLGIIAAVAIPVFLNQQGKANDAAAKADVSTLGLLIATHFVDSNEPPEIDVIDGYWALDGEPSQYPASDGVTLTSFSAADALTWCVAVTADGGTVGTYNYSSTRGLSEGPCAP